MNDIYAGKQTDYFIRLRKNAANNLDRFFVKQLDTLHSVHKYKICVQIQLIKFKKNLNLINWCSHQLNTSNKRGEGCIEVPRSGGQKMAFAPNYFCFIPEPVL